MMLLICTPKGKNSTVRPPCNICTTQWPFTGKKCSMYQTRGYIHYITIHTCAMKNYDTPSHIPLGISTYHSYLLNIVFQQQNTREMAWNWNIISAIVFGLKIVGYYLTVGKRKGLWLKMNINGNCYDLSCRRI